jgi:anaerobic ribonucleoside-triphosphate reductase activating protein
VDIRIAGVIPESIVDGPGIRYTVFTQGCYHNCPGCHNPQTHDPEKGYNKDIDVIINEIKKDPLITGLTISGGEPFLQVPAILELTKRAQAIGLDVLIYTGYTYEELIALNDEMVKEVLMTANYLIDGRFELDKKSYTLEFKGSSNQRLIDLKKTIKTGQITETSFTYGL